MIKKRLIAVLFFSIMIFLAGSITATYCCEKTAGNNPAWCQNVNSESECDSNYRVIPAFCDATSYCKPGTCINQQEGKCKPNTPEIVCDSNNGYWNETDITELPQCQLGCCLIGDRAAFVTQIACNRMSEAYGLIISYTTSISTEIECLASASPRAKGACVYTKDYQKTCELLTKKECQDRAKNAVFEDVTFHEGYLCSAQELGTNCAVSTQTMCDEQNNVRFIDTCGNPANIYDSSHLQYDNYWKMIQEPECGDDAGNKDSANCGKCDYLAGSMCKKKKAGDVTDAGDYICKDLDCKDYRGVYSGSSTGRATATNYPKHGETWCATDNSTGGSTLLPGMSYFRLMCYNGEVTKEECDSTRQKICGEVTIADSTFKTANCKVNAWQTCTSQSNSEDCLDVNLRDCNWIAGGYHFSENGLTNDSNPLAASGVCVPKYQPGFERDTSNNVIGGDMCGLASSICYVRMQRAIGGEWYCDTNDPGSNCSCLDASFTKASGTWQNNLNNICIQLGDCGNKVNYIGKLGKQYSDIVKIINATNATA
jgi:hypothetical protein